MDAIRSGPLIGLDTLAKATLTLPNNLTTTLHLHTTLSSQGIFAGDIVILMTRHARVLDPFGVQHHIAYRNEDKIQYFIGALLDISSIPLPSELVVFHEDFPLEPTLRVQDCSLPQELYLHVRFRNGADIYPLQQPGCTESISTAGHVSDGITPQIETDYKGHTGSNLEQHHGPGATGKSPPPSLFQVFVTSPGGRTLVLLFRPTDSIATNLLRCSTQLPLPPFADLYVRSGGKSLQIERTSRENGLHYEPRLEILLRCRGRMKSGASGGPRDKGRGQRASALIDVAFITS